LHLLDNFCHMYVEEDVAYEVEKEDANNDYDDIGIMNMCFYIYSFVNIYDCIYMCIQMYLHT
jgi:hypothetical protein